MVSVGAMVMGYHKLIGGCSIIEVARHADGGAELSVLEVAQQVGFSAKRIFYITFAETRPDQIRADHATTGRQIIVPLVGQYRLELNNGIQQCTLKCMLRDDAVMIGPGVWRRIAGATAGTVVLVIADETYAETRYFPDQIGRASCRERVCQDG